MRETPYYPVFLDLTGRLCVVVGAGPVAERKARALVACGGDVVVVAPHVSAELLQSSADGELGVEQRGYVRGDLDGAFLVVCIDDSDETRGAVAAEAGERACLLNVAGSPDLTNFVMPSVVRRGALQVAISTGGTAPAAARQARAAISSALGDEWGVYVGLLAETRALVLARHASESRRAELLERATDPRTLERLEAGEKLTAKALLRELEMDEPDAATDASSAGDAAEGVGA